MNWLIVKNFFSMVITVPNARKLVETVRVQGDLLQNPELT